MLKDFNKETIDELSESLASLIMKVIMLAIRVVILIWICYEWFMSGDLPTLQNLVIALVLIGDDR